MEPWISLSASARTTNDFRYTASLGNVDVLIRRLNSVTKRIQAVLELVHRDILFAAFEGPCSQQWTDEHVDSPTLGLEFASLNCNCSKVSNVFKAVFSF